MTSKFDELVAKLTEIFQIDKPELDFGIYKIIDRALIFPPPRRNF